jgi:hypothetical protein
MKKVILIILLALNITPAYADEYSLIKADGSIVNKIVCTAEICGNPNSLYSLLTLKPGESYVRTDTSPVIAHETKPYEIVAKVNADNTWQISHIEPIQVVQDATVLKKTERQFNPETSVMTLPDNPPVVGATILIDKKVETNTPEVLNEIEQWLFDLIAALSELFAGWVWS